MNRSILAVLILCTLSCTAPDNDSGAGNSQAQNPPADAPAGSSEAQNLPPEVPADSSEAQNPPPEVPADSSEAQNQPLDVPADNSPVQNPPVDALQYYLGLKKLSMNQMYIGADGALVNRERRRITGESGEPISLVHSIELITSGVNQDRQAFLVQESYTQPDEMLPQHDRYMCTLLVFISRGGRWVLEDNTMFNESDENGVTSRTEPCDDFELSWENGFPVLLSADGRVRIRNGEYVLEVR